MQKYMPAIVTVCLSLGGVLIFNELNTYRPTVRNDGDSEILHIARQIKKGNAPDFKALNAQKEQNGANKIMRDIRDFRKQGGTPDPDVIYAYWEVRDEMTRQEVTLAQLQ